MEQSLRVREKIDTLDTKDYASATLINPKNRVKKEKYYRIYYDYIANFPTEKTLAAKYRMSISHISRIIKWVVIQLRATEPELVEQRRLTVDRLNNQILELKKILDKDANGVREKVSVLAEVRRTIKLADQIKGLLHTGVTIDMSHNQNVKMNTAPGFSRRGGAAEHEPVHQGDAEDVEGETVEDEGELIE